MKYAVLVFALLSASLQLKGQQLPAMGYCYYTAGATWIPVISSGSGSGFTPGTSTLLYGMNGAVPAALTCDSSGHLTPGGTAGGDLSGTYPNPSVVGLKTVPFCTGFTPTNGQFVQYTTGGTPNPCYSAAAGGSGSFSQLSGDATSTATGGATTVTGLNGTSLAGLATGLLANTTGTGVPSVVTALPSGTTATTQSQADGSTKVATTAYVDTGLATKQASGTYVTNVTGTAPVMSSGGTNPNLFMAQGTTSVDGYLGHTDRTNIGIRAISFAFGQPGGSALSTGVLGYVTVPFGCTITGWSIQADAGTDTIKFLKVAAGTAIPTLGGNSINTSGVALSSGTVIQSTTVSDFTTTTVTANDIVAADLITTSGTGYINAQLVCQQ